MKNILCFGDSNTWGYDPAATAKTNTPVRYAPHVRWPGILAAELGEGFRIIEEAQNGRTTVHDDPTSWAPRNARDYLPACLESHKPLDLIIIMLGTNDLKSTFGVAAGEIAIGLGILLRIIAGAECGLEGKPPRLLVICPPAIGDLSGVPEIAAKMQGAREKSLMLPAYYHAVAKQHGAEFLNSQELVVPSPVDGIHLEERDHRALGRAIAATVKKLFV